ncbi:MAG: antitoxin VapB family protein [Thermoplasmatota archaeon]
MGSKTISLKDSAYEALQSIKDENESFSDVIEKLTKEKTPDYSEFNGILSEETIDSIKEMKENRKESGRIKRTIDKLQSGK